MLDNNEVRAHIRKGEQAVTLLTSLGYVYKTPTNAPHVWEAPVSPVDELKDALEAIIKARVQEGIKEAVKNDPRGPNWHLVEGFVGKDFRVRPENIPARHKLRDYGAMAHFNGVKFMAREINYMRSEEYTGYAVHFQFNTRPYRPEQVWLPLSACVWRQ